MHVISGALCFFPTQTLATFHIKQPDVSPPPWKLLREASPAAVAAYAAGVEALLVYESTLKRGVVAARCSMLSCKSAACAQTAVVAPHLLPCPKLLPADGASAPQLQQTQLQCGLFDSNNPALLMLLSAARAASAWNLCKAGCRLVSLPCVPVQE